MKFVIKDWYFPVSDSASWRFNAQSVVAGNNLFVAENAAMKRLEIYDLKRQVKASHLPMSELETDVFGNVNGLFIQDSGSVLIQQEYRIALWNSFSGKVSTLLRLNETPDSRQWVMSMQYAPPYYDPGQKRIYLRQYAVKCTDTSREFYDTPIEISFRLTDSAVAVSPVKYSLLYKDAYYGFANYVYRLCTDSLNIFSFPTDPNLYVFNRYTQNIKVVGARSRWHTVMAKPLPPRYRLDTEKKVKHMTEMPFYDEVKYDAYRQLYYRFFAKQMPLKNKDGSHNTWEDKRFTLMVMNKGFEVVGEVDLDDYWINPFVALVVEDGLLIKSMDKASENAQGSVKFIKISFNEIP